MGLSQSYCHPIKSEDILKIEDLIIGDTNGYLPWGIKISLIEDFNGKIWLNDSDINGHRTAYAITENTEIELKPELAPDQRHCLLISEVALKVGEPVTILIPEGYFELTPEYEEVSDIDIDKELLTNFSVAGAWHKQGSPWTSQGMFSIIDDDSLDGQIPSSAPGSHTYGYYSLLYPLLESLGLKGNLAIEGRRTGLSDETPKANDNLKTIVRLQNEKGWDILAHSMICLGETLNNWLVDSLDSPLANRILAEGPNKGERSATVSVFDLKTKKQYWPNSDNSHWVQSSSKYIKPYIGDYETKKEVLYNPSFNIDWHWGELKKRAIEFGIDPKGFVTHNSTSSHAMIPGILKYFPHGFSDLGQQNINTVPMLSSAVRSGLEGQSFKGYDGNSHDNTFNEEHFNAFRAQIDEAAESGGWIMFNLHTYRDCWNNSIPGMLVSEGGSYPDEWVIPLKGLDSTSDLLLPPACLGISQWSEWHPCPGTRLYMMWEVLKYAKEKGLINVTSSQGFEIMGNKEAQGYFSNGYKFGMDNRPTIGTRDMYPHYIVSATDEVFYYNSLISGKISYSTKVGSVGQLNASSSRFSITGKTVDWISHENDPTTLLVMDLTGKRIIHSNTKSVNIDSLDRGVYIVCALHSSGVLVDSAKIII